MPRFGLPAEGLQSKFEEDGPSLCSYYWDVGDIEFKSYRACSLVIMD